MIIVVEMAVRLINTVQAAITNMVKKIILQAFNVLGNSISAFQNMELHRAIGTNPSHSQLSKDDQSHPLHSLAAEQAKTMVEGMGTVLKKYQEQMRDQEYGIPLKESKVTLQDFINTAKSYFMHPAHTHWMDAVTEKWLGTHGKKISDLHEVEQKRKRMHAFGQQLIATAEELHQLYESTVAFGKELVVVVELKIKELQQLIIQVKSYTTEIAVEAINEFNKIVTELDAQYEQLKKRLEYDIYTGLDKGAVKYQKAKKIAEEEIDAFKKQVDESIQKAMEIIEENTDTGIEELDKLNKQLKKYYDNLFSMQQQPGLFEQQYYAFAKEEGMKDAELMEYYYMAQNKQYNTIQNYLQQQSDVLLASLHTNTNNLA